jgi:hypothetical protein
MLTALCRAQYYVVREHHKWEKESPLGSKELDTLIYGR